MKQIAFIILLTSITACGPKTDPEIAVEQWCDCYSMNSGIFMSDSLVYSYCLKELTDQYLFIKIHEDLFSNPPYYRNVYSPVAIDSARDLIKEFNVYSEKLCPDAPFL